MTLHRVTDLQPFKIVNFCWFWENLTWTCSICTSKQWIPALKIQFWNCCARWLTLQDAQRTPFGKVIKSKDSYRQIHSNVFMDVVEIVLTIMTKYLSQWPFSMTKMRQRQAKNNILMKKYDETWVYSHLDKMRKNNVNENFK